MIYQWGEIMERGIITMNEHGIVSIPNGEIWMSKWNWQTCSE